ncbi:unnamed protein product [Sphagnum troendelagicum]|uniref:Uncharacterized protein n=1 Tax=Sphagnum troendelagicum TaxID=128251 RepID=A0ABP0TVL4_9BRYO
MKAKLEKYKSKLVQEPTIIVTYLNSQIPKPTDPVELKLVVDLVLFVDCRRIIIRVHRRLVMVVGPKGIAVGPLPDGYGLPRNAGDIDAIRAGQQRRRLRIHMHLAVVVIVDVHHDNVPAFVDEC